MVDPATLAAMALLKPTGPVDGPVLGGFLTGVGCTQDARSLKFYHGGKKYINWEFIWNPLEDAAAAMQQQMGGANGAPGLTGNGTMGLPIPAPSAAAAQPTPTETPAQTPAPTMPVQQNPSTPTKQPTPKQQPVDNLGTPISRLALYCRTATPRFCGTPTFSRARRKVIRSKISTVAQPLLAVREKHCEK